MAKRSKKMKAGGREIPAKTATTGSFSQRLPLRSNRSWFLGLILILLVVLVYTPVWRAGYIWDDEEMVTANPCIVGPLGLKEIWTTSAADICPLTITTFWVEHALWGLAPLPYHLVNILLHSACAVLLWRVLRSLQVPGAWLGAALWALHPVEVESVAWITEMKNTESALFFLLSILFFVKWIKSQELEVQNRNNGAYGLAFLFASLAMASKSSTVILPAVFCLCAWWIEGRWQWRTLARVAPFFLISLAASAISMTTQGLKVEAETHSQWVRSWPDRLVSAGDAVWFYLGKLVWPHPLMTIYPRWSADSSHWISALPLLAVIIVFFVLWLKRESWSRPWFFAFAYFLAALFPVLGLVNMSFFRYSLVADHFQYLASMGPLALAGAGIVQLAHFLLPGKIWQQSSFYAVLLLILGITSWQEARIYESQETLWTHALAGNPACWAGHNNLGRAHVQKGEFDEAIAHFQKALEINPDLDEARNNLGNILAQRGQVNEAIEQFKLALKIDPTYADAHYNLGNSLVQKGQLDQAIEQFRSALKINPYLADAHFCLGNALAQKGEWDEAIEHFQKSLEINPNDAEAQTNLGYALFQKGQVNEGIEHYHQALKINPDYATAHTDLGAALLQKGEVNEAIAEFQEVVRLNPRDRDAQTNLANAQAMATQAPGSK